MTYRAGRNQCVECETETPNHSLVCDACAPDYADASPAKAALDEITLIRPGRRGGARHSHHPRRQRWRDHVHIAR